jgi:hypothetical protein
MSFAIRALGFAVCIAVLGGGCSPAVRVRSRIELPGAAGVLHVNRLHVTTVTSDVPGPLPAPPPGLATSGMLGLEVTLAPGGFEAEVALHGQRLYVRVTAWYDANGNGVVDSGDAVGSLEGAVLAEDRGLCAGNLTVTTPILLAVIP